MRGPTSFLRYNPVTSPPLRNRNTPISNQRAAAAAATFPLPPPSPSPSLPTFQLARTRRACLCGEKRAEGGAFARHRVGGFPAKVVVGWCRLEILTGPRALGTF